MLINLYCLECDDLIKELNTINEIKIKKELKKYYLIKKEEKKLKKK